MATKYTSQLNSLSSFLEKADDLRNKWREELNDALDESGLDTEAFYEENKNDITPEIMDLFNFHSDMWKIISNLNKQTGSMSYKPTLLSIRALRYLGIE